MRQTYSAKDRKTDGSVRKGISSLFIFEDKSRQSMEFRLRFRQQAITVNVIFGGQKCLLVKQISEIKPSF